MSRSFPGLVPPPAEEEGTAGEPVDLQKLYFGHKQYLLDFFRLALSIDTDF